MTKIQVYTQDTGITLLPLLPVKIIIFRSVLVSMKVHINKVTSLCLGLFYYTFYSINYVQLEIELQVQYGIHAYLLLSINM